MEPEVQPGSQNRDLGSGQKSPTCADDVHDLIRLFTPTGDEPGYAETHLAPDVFALRHARFLDLAIANARKLEGPKKWLSLLLVVKYALRLRPMGTWGAKTIIHQIEAGAWEEMNPNYVRDVFARNMPHHPMRVAEPIRRAINAGAFSNGQINECRQQDVFLFLQNVRGDVVYLDPPYASTSAYERSCAPLDSLLRGETVRGEPSMFSTERPEKTLTCLLEAADHVPIIVLSYGNAVVDLPQLLDIVRRFRPKATGREYRHAHCTGLASAESRARNREFVIVGRK